MKKLYRDELIDLYDADTAKRWIEQVPINEKYETYLNLLGQGKKDGSEYRTMYTFENFVLKYLYINNLDSQNKEYQEFRRDPQNASFFSMSRDNVNEVRKLIDRIYDEVSNVDGNNIDDLLKASELFKSTFLRDGVVQGIATPEQYKKLSMTMGNITRYINKSFGKFLQDFDGHKQAEIKSSDVALDEKERRLISNYFSVRQKGDYSVFADPKFEEYLEKFFIETFRLDKLTIDEKEFIAEFVMSHFFALDNIKKAEIGFNSDFDNPGNGGSCANGNYVEVNLESVLTNNTFGFTHAVMHEMNHGKQYQHDGRNSMTEYYRLLYVLTRRYPQVGNTSAEEYDNNYEYIEIETESERMADNKLKAFLLPLYYKYGIDATKIEKEIGDSQRKVNKRRPNCISQKEYGGVKVPNYYYNIERLREIVGSHPEVLDEYEMLKSIFKDNGEQKDINEVLKQGVGLGGEEALITDYLLDVFYTGKMDNIDFSNYSEQDKKKFSGHFNRAFCSEITKTREFIKNPEYLGLYLGNKAFMENAGMVLTMARFVKENEWLYSYRENYLYRLEDLGKEAKNLTLEEINNKVKYVPAEDKKKVYLTFDAVGKRAAEVASSYRNYKAKFDGNYGDSDGR